MYEFELLSVRKENKFQDSNTKRKMLEHMILQCDFLKINTLICACFSGMTLREKKLKFKRQI